MRERSELTVLDWIGVIMTAGTVVALIVLPRVAAPWFEIMYRDLGGEMPALTRFVLSAWGGPVLSIIPAALLFVGLVLQKDAPIAQRRLLLVLAFVATVIGSALYLFGLYLPIFTIAGNIQ